MKKHFTFITLILSTTIPLSAFAAPFTAEQLISATQVALVEFNKNNSSHGVHLTGFKTWISAEEAKVKIYVDHEGMNMDFNYLCQNHQGQIHCQPQ
jgi:hypothetical protein